MRATILFLTIFLLCHLTASGSVFIFKTGKSIEGSIQHEDQSTIRILETTGLEMTLRKSELNLSATAKANAQLQELPAIVSEPKAATVTEKVVTTAPVKIYTNRDVKMKRSSSITAPAEHKTSQAWRKSIAKLERDFTRLQGACRAAGGGPNISKVLRSHTYTVNGKQVRVTGYWADPANIEEARQICERAINTQESLDQARRAFQNFLLQHQEGSTNSLTAQ